MILSAAILVANAITLSDLREETLRSVEANMQSQAIVLAQEGDRSLKVLDLALSIIADHIRHLGVTDSEAFQRRLAGYDIHELLKKKSAGLLHVDAISLVGIDGKLINASRHWPIPDVDVSDRDYFQAMKSDAALKVFISKPVINQATRAWTIYLARRLNAPNGSFMGLMLGGITVAHFERFFQSIALRWRRRAGAAGRHAIGQIPFQRRSRQGHSCGGQDEPHEDCECPSRREPDRSPVQDFISSASCRLSAGRCRQPG
jgi:hypothetical protein